MFLSNNRTEGSTTVVKTVCAIVFFVFVFIYVFCYQDDTIAYSQHVLSGGVTVYSRLIGGIIITVVLGLLYFTMSRLMSRKPACIHALACFPSLYLLAMITDFHPSRSLSPWGWWAIAMPVVMAVWWALVYFLGELLRYRCVEGHHSEGFTLKTVGFNLLLLCVMMLGVGLLSNGNDIMHYRLRMERMLMHGELEDALEVGKLSDQSDANLTMLRAYALARQGRLGDELFKYPVIGTSESLVPHPQGAELLMLSPDSVYTMLGAIPRKGMTTREYLKAIVKSGQATPLVNEYLLCGLLIDRDLDGFVRLLIKTHKIDDSLPLHYREALILYSHRRSNPLVVYKNTVMDTDYDDMQRLEAEAKTPEERRLNVFKQFYGTYWQYYDYSANTSRNSAEAGANN